jgi:hypothetical protein
MSRDVENHHRGVRTITLRRNMQNPWLGYNFVLIIATLQQIQRIA